MIAVKNKLPMENKERYYQALAENKGRLNEIDIGEMIGLEEDETRQIIVQLLSEHKIESHQHQPCNYTVIKTKSKVQLKK